MGDETSEYRRNGLTVWFAEMPEGNPFKIQSEFGQARATGRGNVFDEANIYREALEQIVARGVAARETAIAQEALDAVDLAIMAGMPKLPKPGSSP